MRLSPLLRSAILSVWLISSCRAPAESLPLPGRDAHEPNRYAVRGVVTRVEPEDRRVVVRHEAIPGYMGAMTMPFNVKEPNDLLDLRAGDEIAFRLNVTDTASWIDHISRLGTNRIPVDTGKPTDPSSSGPGPAGQARHPLLDFEFTNERDQAVSLSDFRGQALAITFFFTRCPVPDFCPRLSRNFQEASQKLAAMTGGPTNWHFLSISFDPAFDTPAVLKAYGEHYNYDPARWSFLTGPSDKINELARLSGVEIDPDAGLFNHNFRTIIINADGQLQTTFPFGGNISDPIVGEMLKACVTTNAPHTRSSRHPQPVDSPPPIAADGAGKPGER